jgi:hypothetical protein
MKVFKFKRKMEVFKLWVEEDGLVIIENRYFSTFDKALKGQNKLINTISWEGMSLKLTQYIENNLVTYYDEKAKIGVYIKRENVN